MLLKTESRWTALLIHGAMVGTVDKLRRLSMLDQATKDAEISAYRTSAVSSVRELVQSEAVRAAYCHVRDLVARSRPVQSGRYSDSSDDSFTSESIEGSGGDQGVWDLMVNGDAELSNDTESTVPDSRDVTRSGRGRRRRTRGRAASRARYP